MKLRFKVIAKGRRFVRRLHNCNPIPGAVYLVSEPLQPTCTRIATLKLVRLLALPNLRCVRDGMYQSIRIFDTVLLWYSAKQKCGAKDEAVHPRKEGDEQVEEPPYDSGRFPLAITSPLRKQSISVEA